MINLYTWPTPNGRKISILLEELEVQYNIIPIDIQNDEQFSKKFSLISASNKIPAIVDNENGIKRLSDEYIRFKVSGFGELIEKEDIGINPQKLLWGESVALVRSAKEQGIIRVEAEVICDSLNGPDQAFVEFSTIAPRHVLLYDENITKELMQNYNTPATNNTIDDLKLKLRKTEKELQEYKLMEVGRQQQNFIQ